MLSTDWDIEASLTVDEPCDPVVKVVGDSIKPVGGIGPFLLIVRTGRIITVHATPPYEQGVTARTSTAGCSGFPAFSRVCSAGLLPQSRNGLLTAAVYRGLGSELRPKANPSP